MWDTKAKKFMYRINHKELLVWYFALLCEFLATLSSLYVCLREIFVKDTNVPVHKVLFQLSMAMMNGVVGVGTGFLILKDGGKGVGAWDDLCIVEKTVCEGNYIQVDIQKYLNCLNQG